MPATALDPKTALVVIDLQKGVTGFSTTPPAAGVVANTRRLVDAFRRAELPVVLVTVGFSPNWEDAPRTRVESRPSFPMSPDFFQLHPDLEPTPGDILITKRQPNAFYGTELDLQLRRRHVTGIVITGIATSIGVDTTARAAQERSYNVTFASDAIADLDQATHDFVMQKMFPRIGELDTTEALLALLRQPGR